MVMVMATDLRISRMYSMIPRCKKLDNTLRWMNNILDFCCMLRYVTTRDKLQMKQFIMFLNAALCQPHTPFLGHFLPSTINIW
jgi:hypothetical protein